MLYSLAVQNYRSLKEVILPLDQCNLVTGANGSGKSNLYRGLRLLAETATGTSTASIAAEGGIESLLWAGPGAFSRKELAGDHPVQGKVKQGPVSLRFGFAAEQLSYAIDYGLPEPVPLTMFGKDPCVKREVIWHGPVWHPSRTMVERRGPMVRARDDNGKWQVIEEHMQPYDSMLARLPDPVRAPEVYVLREAIQSWRFYDHFRSDQDAPARQSNIGTRTPVLSNDGHDLASVWRTIVEVGDHEGLEAAVSDAFPGARVDIVQKSGRFDLSFQQDGLLRPLSQAELSDGTLRYLLWIAALLTPRPPELMVLNEPETSLHPELLPPLGRLMKKCAESTQLWVISHAHGLIDALSEESNHVHLTKRLGETMIEGLGTLDFETPAWKWPVR